uniref:Uncharacterized protein n=1 Tax=Rhizophora mucronata TaxID=61149 RepID=A0A2P2IYL4_RHIMU
MPFISYTLYALSTTKRYTNYIAANKVNVNFHTNPILTIFL